MKMSVTLSILFTAIFVVSCGMQDENLKNERTFEDHNTDNFFAEHDNFELVRKPDGQGQWVCVLVFNNCSEYGGGQSPGWRFWFDAPSKREAQDQCFKFRNHQEHKRNICGNYDANLAAWALQTGNQDRQLVKSELAKAAVCKNIKGTNQVHTYRNNNGKNEVRQRRHCENVLKGVFQPAG